MEISKLHFLYKNKISKRSGSIKDLKSIITRPNRIYRNSYPTIGEYTFFTSVHEILSSIKIVCSATKQTSINLIVWNHKNLFLYFKRYILWPYGS